jgi:hypothetical protein
MEFSLCDYVNKPVTVTLDNETVLPNCKIEFDDSFGDYLLMSKPNYCYGEFFIDGVNKSDKPNIVKVVEEVVLVGKPHHTLGLRWEDFYDIMENMDLGGKYENFEKILVKMFESRFSCNITIDWLD